MELHPTIIFDLDGTLADTIHDLVPSLNRVTERQGLGPVTTQQIGPTSGKGVIKMLELAFQLNNRPLPSDLLSQMFDEFLEDYWQNISVNTVLYEETEAVLQKFANENWNLGVCTNKPIRMAEKLLLDMGIKTFFASITGADSFEFRKPDPRHLQNTIKLAGGSVDRAIMVGDSETDIRTAQNANIPIIAVNFGYSDQPVETFDPDLVISHYSELYVAAEGIINS